jgi:uncharacterized protein YjbI with pentapeptide repeats
VRIENPTGLSVCWLLGRLQATFIVKGSFQLIPGEHSRINEEGNTPTGDIAWPNSSEESLYYGSDFAPWKLKADLLLVGTCHPPGGQCDEACPVEFQVGAWSKMLGVIGDRSWNGLLTRRMSDPIPFVQMPVRYDRAYGGEGFKRNPIGIGFDRVCLPNIEDPRYLISSYSDQPDPAGFGPLHSSWEQRTGRPSKLKKSYLKERWPWYPEDFDWSYFNSAPRDQQLESYLRGDELLRMVNLHPEHPVFESRLPGIRPQVFVQYKDGGDRQTLHEVPINLDTLWVDMDLGKLVLVWRGQAPVSHIKLQDVAEVHVVQSQVIDRSLTADSYAAEIESREREQRGAEEQEAELERLEDEADNGEMEKSQGDFDKLTKKLDQEAEQQKEEAEALLIQNGLDPELLNRQVAPMDFPKMMANLKAMVAESPTADPKLFQAITELEANPPVVPPTEGEPDPWTRDRCLTHAHEHKSFDEEDLSGLDLSGIDLRGVDLSGVVLAKANLAGAQLTGSKFVGVDLSGANLSETDLSDADLSEADLTGANLVKSNLQGTNLDRATLCEADLTQAILNKTKGSLADFSKANLTEAQFVGSRLSQPDFSECQLERAIFRHAIMPNATFEACRAHAINMESAEMLGMRAGDGPDFSGGDFRRLKADGSFWEDAKLNGARFQWATLRRADFTGATLEEAQLGAAQLGGASFEDGSLEKASLIFANVFQGSFERTNLTRCDLRRANCYEAEFWDATLELTLLEDADLTMTKLANES